MDIFRPRDLAEALQVKSARPRARPLAGGTDAMVELNMGGQPPEAILDLGLVEELNTWYREGDMLKLGAGVSYTSIIRELRDTAPGLALAARSVGSPQIRNRGTVGGNAATASPGGDALPWLFALDAQAELASASGTRTASMAELITGPGHCDLQPDEIITSFRVPITTGPQQFAKVGQRNAMVIAVCSFALVLLPETQQVRVCAGSVAPTPVRVTAAESFMNGVLVEGDLWDTYAMIDATAIAKFADIVAAEVRPIDDVRGTADYRRHATGTLAKRTLTWAWSEYREGTN